MASYPRSRWRVIIHGPKDGATNMAIDDAIAEHVGTGDSPPTLRFYAWEPACLSLGYGQRSRDADREKLAAHGWDLVRRPTGGRAILHIDELTYSVTLPPTDPRASGDVVESYRRLSRGLMAGLERIGAAVESTKSDAASRRLSGPVCFEKPSDYEITAQGKKLIGSAQMRRSDVVLQHGTLPLKGDITRICDVLAFTDESARRQAKERLAERAITLEDALGVRMSMVRSVGELMAGFVEALNLELEEGQLSAAEEGRVEEIRARKYANDEWTLRR